MVEDIVPSPQELAAQEATWYWGDMMTVRIWYQDNQRRAVRAQSRHAWLACQSVSETPVRSSYTPRRLWAPASATQAQSLAFRQSTHHQQGQLLLCKVCSVLAFERQTIISPGVKGKAVTLVHRLDALGISKSFI